MLYYQCRLTIGFETEDDRLLLVGFHFTTILYCRFPLPLFLITRIASDLSSSGPLMASTSDTIAFFVNDELDYHPYPEPHCRLLPEDSEGFYSGNASRQEHHRDIRIRSPLW